MEFHLGIQVDGWRSPVYELGTAQNSDLIGGLEPWNFIFP